MNEQRIRCKRTKNEQGKKFIKLENGFIEI